MTDYFAPVVAVVVGLAGGGTIWGYLKDRRTAKAKGKVATASVEIEIDTNRLSYVEAQVKALTAAFATERASLESTIQHLQQDLANERAESEKKDIKIAELVRRVEEIQHALDLVKSELAETRRPENGN